MNDFIIVNNLTVRACAVIGVSREGNTVYVKYMEEESVLIHDCLNELEAIKTFDDLSLALNAFFETKSKDTMSKIKEAITNVVSNKEEECAH